MTDERRFSEAEVEAILRLAIARQDQGNGLSRAELMEVVGQLGVDAEELDDAIAEHDDAARMQAQTDAWRLRHRRDVFTHGGAFVGAMMAMIALNLLTTPGLLWFVWPMLAWGTALGFHIAAYLKGPDPMALEAGRQLEARRSEKQRRRAEKAERVARRKERDEALKRASEDLGDAMKAGVTGLLETIGRSLREVASDATAPSSATRVRVTDDKPRATKVSEAEVEAELEALRRRKAR